jgi:alkylation response protein AidB-like acyl-CoA dehydrogenase
LDFQNARVPLDHLIGSENDGFRIVMYNFNHERFYICTMCVRLSRVCMEECIKYALKRKTFGKVRVGAMAAASFCVSLAPIRMRDLFYQALHEHQAIRMKVGLISVS